MKIVFSKIEKGEGRNTYERYDVPGTVLSHSVLILQLSGVSYCYSHVWRG